MVFFFFEITVEHLQNPDEKPVDLMANRQKKPVDRMKPQMPDELRAWHSEVMKAWHRKMKRTNPARYKEMQSYAGRKRQESVVQSKKMVH